MNITHPSTKKLIEFNNTDHIFNRYLFMEKYTNNQCESLHTAISNYTEHTGVTFRTGTYGPSYSPVFDNIIPPSQLTETAESYYFKILHEIIHSTGHGSRLNRSLTTFKWDNPYNLTPLYYREELIAEYGAIKLATHFDIYTSGIQYISCLYLIELEYRKDKTIIDIPDVTLEVDQAVNYFLENSNQ